MRYLITYDLREKAPRYEELYGQLKMQGAVPVLESAWFLTSNETPEKLRDYFAMSIDGNDGLLVVSFDAWAERNLSSKIT